MPEEIENIEARLCAYIDGELDEAARQDIERHLESNPQHRRLMLEMAKARQLLQDLPRVPAPPEIEEAIHSHMERSILLDDSATASAPLRISRWPQIVATAAIILLAAGLAIIVWLVIRPPAASHTTAINLPPPAPATAPAVRMETAQSSRLDQARNAAAEPGMQANAFADTQSSASRPSADFSPERALAKAAPLPQIENSVAADSAIDLLGLTATTADLPETELQLRAFLSSQGLHAQAIDLPPQSLWSAGEAQKAFAVRSVDLEQVQSLRRLLDGSATTTLDDLDSSTTRPSSLTSPMVSPVPTTEPAAGSAPPASQPAAHAKVDLLILLRVQAAQPPVPASPESAAEPTSQPATAPAFEDFQMP
jgi:hypothetical protein